MMSGITEDPSVAFRAAVRRFDPAFKLFGSTIAVLSLGDCKSKRDERMKKEEIPVAVVEKSPSHTCSQVVGGDPAESEPGSSSGSNDGCEEALPNTGIRRAAATVPCAEFGAPLNHGDTSNSLDDIPCDTTQGNVRKKPVKPVTCPRCDSFDTKFCYYNNYNVNQPRHFCKNCQRYWTAGGTLRNVPVGAGRRRNKHSVTHQGSGLLDDSVARDDEPDAAQQNLSCSDSSGLGMNRQVKGFTSSKRHALPFDVSSQVDSDGPSSSVILNFGKDGFLCEGSDVTSCGVSKVAVLNGLGRNSTKVPAVEERTSSFQGLSEAESELLHKKHTQSPNERSSAVRVSNAADAKMRLQNSSKSLGTSTLIAQLEEPQSMEYRVGSIAQTELPTKANVSLGWAAGSPFALTSGQWQHGVNIGWGKIALPAVAPDWNYGSNNMTNHTTQTKPVVNHPSASMAVGNQVVGIAGSLMRDSAWGPRSWGNTLAVSWPPAAAAVTNFPCGGPMLGKHRLEQNEPKDEIGGSLWVPKTSRIHGPEEATLARREQKESATSDGILSDVQSKAECTETGYSRVQTQHSNPAALTRSIAFQENVLASQDAAVHGEH